MSQTKHCSKCGLAKPLGEFGARPERGGGRRSSCKQCQRERVAAYRENNREKLRADRLALYVSDPERHLEYVARYRRENRHKIRVAQNLSRSSRRDEVNARERARYAQNKQVILARKAAWREANRELLRARDRERKNADRESARAKSRADSSRRRATPRGKLENTIRVRLHKQLTAGSKAGRSTFALFGFSVDDLKSHLERQFLPGMSWSNYGPVWHVDHRVPLASFDYSSPDDPAFKAAWALTNLQPLWASENKSKGAKLLLLV